MSKLLYIGNRYRRYDKVMYRVLAENFELIVLWISPPPTGERPSQELLKSFRYRILDSRKQSKLQPWHLARTISLAREVVAHGNSVRLVVSSTSDSWKSKVAFAAAWWRGVPIAFRKERWLDVTTPLLTRAYWNVDQRLTDFIERRARGMLVGGRKAREYLVARGHRDTTILPFSYLHEDLAAKQPNPWVADELRDFGGDSLLVLYLGRIMPQKGLHILIGVVQEMIAEGEDLKLLVVGDPISQKTGRGAPSTGYYDRCRRLAGRDPRILFRGSVPAHRVHDYYRAADVFVHPHVFRVCGRDKFDGWGNVITEAASTSTPIIASDRVGSAFDIVDHGVSGFLLRSNRLEGELRQALVFFCRNRKAVESFGQEARRRYELTVSADQTVASVHRLMDGRKLRREAPA